jgi:hypothetical protein
MRRARGAHAPFRRELFLFGARPPPRTVHGTGRFVSRGVSPRAQDLGGRCPSI